MSMQSFFFFFSLFCIGTSRCHGLGSWYLLQSVLESSHSLLLCYTVFFFYFFISVAVAPVCDLTSSDKYELLSNFAISCSQTTVHSSSPPIAGADSQTCASTTSADTWWSCSPWVRTRPCSTPSATSSRCRRSWRNSTDVAESVLHERARHRWPPDLHYMPYGRNKLTMGLRNLSCRFSFPSDVWLQFCDKRRHRGEFYNLFNCDLQSV